MWNKVYNKFMLDIISWISTTQESFKVYLVLNKNKVKPWFFDIKRTIVTSLEVIY